MLKGVPLIRDSRRMLRALLRGVAAILVTAPVTIAASAGPAQAIGPDLLPVTVTNNTGRSEAVHLYIIGQDIRSGGKLGWVNAAGGWNPWPAGGLPPTPAPDASIPGPSNGGSVTVRFPRFISARIYFSFGKKLDLRLTPDGFVQPAPWAGDSNKDTLLDWSEFTYNNDGLWLNSTQVDMLAIPHAVSVTGSDGVTNRSGDLIANGRENIINQIKAEPAFAKSVYTRSDGTVLRVLAPGKSIQGGLMAANYLDAYINSAWNSYTNKTLTVVPRVEEPSRRFYGRTQGNNMVFTAQLTNGLPSGPVVTTVAKPTTSNVFGCDGVFNAPNTPPFIEPEIKRTLCAGLNRGTLGPSSQEPVLDNTQFYKNSAPHHYSRIMHANHADGRAYGFPYDDVAGKESLVHSGDPRSAAVILHPFVGGTQPTGSRIISNWHNKCIDVPNWNFADGQRLIVWDCHDGTNQKFALDNGALRTENNKCIDVAGGATGNGTPVQLYTCNNSGAQKWTLNGNGDLVNPQSGRCLDIEGVNPNNGVPVHIWDCVNGPNQKWRRG
jgi:hypothetical protein